MYKILESKWDIGNGIQFQETGAGHEDKNMAIVLILDRCGRHIKELQKQGKRATVSGGLWDRLEGRHLIFTVEQNDRIAFRYALDITNEKK